MLPCSMIALHTMSFLPVRLCATQRAQCHATIVLSLVTFYGVQAQSATVASQDFGQSQVGTPFTLSVPVPAVTPGPATLSLRYSLDFSLGACTPSASGCAALLTFNPTKPGLRQDAVIVKNAAGQVAEEIFLHGVGLGPMPVFSPATATLEVFIPPLSVYVGVSGIAAEPNGKILILSGSPTTIYEFDPANNQLAPVLGAPTSSSFPGSLYGLTTDAAGNIYYGDLNSGIHRLDSVTSTDSLYGASPGAEPLLVDPSGVVFYIQGDQVFKINPNTKTVALVAGNGVYGFGGDGGPAVNAQLDYPNGVALDPSGNLYIADSANHRVRRVDAFGTITTISGTGVNGSTGDGGPAVNAELSFPSALQTDAAGDLYVASGGPIRRIDAGTGLISTVAGAAPYSSLNPFLAVGFSASAQNLSGSSTSTIDADNNLWIAAYIYPAAQGSIESLRPPIRFNSRSPQPGRPSLRPFLY